MSYQSPSQNISVILGFICSIFSLVGSLFTIGVYTFVPATRKNFFFFLAFHLAISDFGIAITGMTLDDPHELNKTLCTVMATVRGFSIMSSFISNLIIALFVYKAILIDNYVQGFAKQKLTFLISNYLFSFFGSVGPLLSGVYGPSNIYCWINTENNSFIASFWMICEAYIALPMTLVWVSLIYCLIITHLRNTVRDDRKGDVNKLAMLPLLFVITNGITLIDIVIESFFEKNLGLNIVHTCLRQFQGFFHAILYASGMIKEEISYKIIEMRQHRRFSSDEDEMENEFSLRDEVNKNL